MLNLSFPFFLQDTNHTELILAKFGTFFSTELTPKLMRVQVSRYIPLIKDFLEQKLDQSLKVNITNICLSVCLSGYVLIKISLHKVCIGLIFFLTILFELF